MDKSKQKKLLTELMEADEKDGLYRMDVVKEAEETVKFLNDLNDRFEDYIGYESSCDNEDLIEHWINRWHKLRINIILQYTEKICRGQREACKNEVLSSVEFSSHSAKAVGTIMLTPLLTDPPAICGDEKQNLTDKQ